MTLNWIGALVGWQWEAPASLWSQNVDVFYLNSLIWRNCAKASNTWKPENNNEDSRDCTTHGIQMEISWSADSLSEWLRYKSLGQLILWRLKYFNFSITFKRVGRTENSVWSQGHRSHTKYNTYSTKAKAKARQSKQWFVKEIYENEQTSSTKVAGYLEQSTSIKRHQERTG